MTRVAPLFVAALASSALFLVILDGTIVNVALVPIAHALNADVHSVQWVVGAYFLAQAAIIPIVGYFADRFGVKRLFLCAFTLFILSSGLCGLSRTEAELIFSRVLQGLGGGALYPLAQSIAFGAYAGKDRIKGISVTMIPGVLAPALGPWIGGWLSLHAGWASIFLINLPLGSLFAGLAWRFLPADLPRTAKSSSSFDVLGLLSCVLGVLALTYGFSLVGSPESATHESLHPEGQPHGWTNPLVLSCITLGLLTLSFFVVHVLRRREPVLDLRLFQRKTFTAATLIACLNNGIFFGSLLVLPYFLIQVRSPGLTALDVGWMLMPQGMGSALMLITMTRLRLRQRLQVTPWLISGSLLLALSSWGIASAAETPGTSAFLPWIFVRGMGFGTVFQLTQAMAVEGLERSELPRATSLFNVVRQISSSVGLALLLSTFGQSWSAHASALSSSPVDTALRLQKAGGLAFRDLFHGLAALSGIGFLLTWWLLRDSRAPVRPEPNRAALSEAEGAP